MYYIIYKTTNIINEKIYVGKHKTKDLNDGYLGSGKLLNYAIKKYGIENFTREVLYLCSNEDEMNAKENEIVTEDFCTRLDTYNLCVGGHGGFSYINRKGINYTFEKNKRISPFGTSEFIKKHKSDFLRGSKIGSLKRTDLIKQGIIDPRTFLGRVHSQETKNKMSAAKKGKTTGIKNSQYGTMWITNGNENKKIKKEVDIIPEGWYKGRTT